MPIWTHYEPEQVDGQYGWLWQGTSDQPDWALVYTGCAQQEPALFEIVFLDDRRPPQDAYRFQGLPYLACNEPIVVPGKCDLLEVVIRFGEGSVAGNVIGADKPGEAEQITNAVLDALGGGYGYMRLSPKDKENSPSQTNPKEPD